jgi:hypothetical protein
MTNEFETGFQAGALWAIYHHANDADFAKLAGDKIRTLKGRGLSDAQAIHELLAECLDAKRDAEPSAERKEA